MKMSLLSPNPRWSMSPIPHDDVLVISMEIDGYDVKRVVIDSRSSMNVLFLDVLRNTGMSKRDLQKMNFPLMGFVSITTYSVRSITLPVFLRVCWKAWTINVAFIVVDAPSSYNSILWCSTLNPHQIIHSAYHQILKFPTPDMIKLVRGDRHVARSCYVHSMRRRVLKKKEQGNFIHPNR